MTSGARRGAALLLVLGALVVSVSAALIAARAITRGKLATAAADADTLAGDLLVGCESPARAWLVNESARVALPAEADLPAVQVLHDTWEDAGRRIEVRITAWDQCGMVPIQAVRFGHPLAGVVSEAARDAALALPAEWLDRPGLDQFPGAGSVFPELPATESTVFGSGEQPSANSRSEYEGTAIGAELATHSPGSGRARRGQTPVLLNVNTTPRRLLEEAMRLAGRGGVETILDKRGRGEPAAVGDVTTDGTQRESGVRFIASSPAWAFRIDVRAGMIQRSVWEVWAHESSDWEVVQRLAIDE